MEITNGGCRSKNKIQVLLHDLQTFLTNMILKVVTLLNVISSDSIPELAGLMRHLAKMLLLFFVFFSFSQYVEFIYVQLAQMASCSYDHNHFENPSALSISIAAYCLWVICTTELMWIYALLLWKPFQVDNLILREFCWLSGGSTVWWVGGKKNCKTLLWHILSNPATNSNVVFFLSFNSTVNYAILCIY